MSDDEKPTRKPTIRPVSRVTSGPLSKLRNAECFAEIDRRLRLGWSTSALAEAVQEEFQECREISVNYLKKMIDQYRQSIPPAELSMTSSNSLVARNATKKVANGLDEFEELDWLYSVQKKRIEMDFAIEGRVGKTFDKLHREMYVAMKLIKQISDLKMDLGLSKRQLGTMELTGQIAADASARHGSDAVGKVITDPESRRKLLGLADKFMAFASKASVDAIAEALDQKEIIDVAIDANPTNGNEEDDGE